MITYSVSVIDEIDPGYSLVSSISPTGTVTISLGIEPKDFATHFEMSPTTAREFAQVLNVYVDRIEAADKAKGRS
jgi:hypothetical protein